MQNKHEQNKLFLHFLRRNQSSQLNFNKHRRNLLQIRNTNIPKPPNNVHEVIEAYKNDVVVEHYSRTLHENSDDQFYKGSYECDDFSYSYFASDHVMNNIRDNIPEEKREFLMDATFKICPLGKFYQLLIIYIAFCDQVSFQTALRYLILFVFQF